MRDADIEPIGRLMTPEKALRWLLEFGSDWVECRNLRDTWADDGIYWLLAVENGDLEERDAEALKLTPKAIKLIGELKCTEANRLTGTE